LNQIDIISIQPFETSLIQNQKLVSTVNETYMLNSKLILSFLNKCGFNNKTFNGEEVTGFIDNMKNQWIKYNIEYKNKQ
jgi:hypothetical protein